MATIIQFPSPKTEEPPRSLVDEEEEIAREIFAIIKGHDQRAVFMALASVVGNLGLNLLEAKPLKY
jgi:hypothetical protein